MYDDYYELREKTILKDTTIYMQWQSNLESITLEYAGSPQCGQQPADYPVKVHNTLGFDDNESVYINDDLGWYDEEGKLISTEEILEISYNDGDGSEAMGYTGVHDFTGIAKFE